MPTLVIHGDSDAIVPTEVSGQRTHDPLSPEARVVTVKDGPHGINVSHAEGFNAALARLPHRADLIASRVVVRTVRCSAPVRGCWSPCCRPGGPHLLSRRAVSDDACESPCRPM